MADQLAGNWYLKSAGICDDENPVSSKHYPVRCYVYIYISKLLIQATFLCAVFQSF